MIQRIIKIALLVFTTIGMSCDQQEYCEDSLDCYFKESLPYTNPILFFPEYLDEEMNIRDITFSVDYKEFFFTLISNDTVIMTMKHKSGKWTGPSIASFSGSFSDFEPCITPDGENLYFASMRPSKEKPIMSMDIDIWKVHRTNKGWSNPEILDNTINTNCMEYYPSVSNLGNMYFGRNDSSLTRGDIYCSHIQDNSYTIPGILPEVINLPSTSFNAFVSPAENYIIFSSYIKEDELWHSDLFISYKKKNGEWESPKNMGEVINSTRNELSPWISYDGKYLFFSSTRLDTSEPSNKHNIFWVSTSVIEGFNPVVDAL